MQYVTHCVYYGTLWFSKTYSLGWSAEQEYKSRKPIFFGSVNKGVMLQTRVRPPGGNGKGVHGQPSGLKVRTYITTPSIFDSICNGLEPSPFFINLSNRCNRHKRSTTQTLFSPTRRQELPNPHKVAGSTRVIHHYPNAGISNRTHRGYSKARLSTLVSSSAWGRYWN